MSPKKAGLGNPKAVTPQEGSSADFSSEEMTAEIHRQLGKLLEAVDTLKKSSEKHSDKLTQLGEDVAAGRMLLKTITWIIPLAVTIVTVLIQFAFHFWK